MPDKMRVTSFMGVIKGLATPGGTSPSNSVGGFGNHRPSCASNLMRCQVFFPLRETAHEHSTRLVAMPRPLRHAAGTLLAVIRNHTYRRYRPRSASSRIPHFVLDP